MSQIPTSSESGRGSPAATASSRRSSKLGFAAFFTGVVSALLSALPPYSAARRKTTYGSAPSIRFVSEFSAASAAGMPCASTEVTKSVAAGAGAGAPWSTDHVNDSVTSVASAWWACFPDGESRPPPSTPSSRSTTTPVTDTFSTSPAMPSSSCSSLDASRSSGLVKSLSYTCTVTFGGIGVPAGTASSRRSPLNCGAVESSTHAVRADTAPSPSPIENTTNGSAPPEPAAMSASGMSAQEMPEMARMRPSGASGSAASASSFLSATATLRTRRTACSHLWKSSVGFDLSTASEVRPHVHSPLSRHRRRFPLAAASTRTIRWSVSAVRWGRTVAHSRTSNLRSPAAQSTPASVRYTASGGELYARSSDSSFVSRLRTSAFARSRSAFGSIKRARASAPAPTSSPRWSSKRKTGAASPMCSPSTSSTHSLRSEAVAASIPSWCAFMSVHPTPAASRTATVPIGEPSAHLSSTSGAVSLSVVSPSTLSPPPPSRHSTSTSLTPRRSRSQIVATSTTASTFCRRHARSSAGPATFATICANLAGTDGEPETMTPKSNPDASHRGSMYTVGAADTS